MPRGRCTASEAGCRAVAVAAGCRLLLGVAGRRPPHRTRLVLLAGFCWWLPLLLAATAADATSIAMAEAELAVLVLLPDFS